MKKLIVTITLMAILIGLNAQHSVADTDDFMAAKVNPAALSFGNASGVAFINELDTDDKFENMSFIFNTNNLSYYLQVISGDEQNEDVYNHRISLSQKLFKNFYVGTSYDWQNKEFNKGDFYESVLFRPTDFLSFGANVEDVFSSERIYDLGIAIRPLFFKKYLGNRISFSTDIRYNEDWDDPVFGIQTEILDGLHLGGFTKYDTDEIGLSFSYDMGNIKFGGFHFSDGDSDNDVNQAFVNISNKAFRN